MARRRNRPGDSDDGELSVNDLIEGPTEVISPAALAAARAAGPAPHTGVDETHDLSAYATRDPTPPAAVTEDLTGRSGGHHGEPPAQARVVLPALPRPGALHRRALRDALPGIGRSRRSDAAPPVELAVAGVTVDRAHLAEYDRVCGFRLADALPATYPHVLGFPLALRLMTLPEFPFPLAGVVHVGNRITVHRPVPADVPWDFVAHAGNLRPHTRGRQVDVVLVGSVDGEEVWRGVSTYLGRERGAGGGAGRDPGERAAPPVATAHWRLTPRVGTDYARVSGDHNPIHTSRLGARLFGFPRPIAHGMWSKARCLAALESRLPEAYTVEVGFKLPVPLPSTVAFSAVPGWDFALHDTRTGRPHLVGTVR
ncbi:MaoC/PaaZ C-terminal domain-containing protein [Micromonospora sp. HUAS LYJ1]|uniref:MaoC/PaaZ C-terminal domain-containing protein n=1 Tax=Micromonospora sp. HUAS LYJ1 TaxID=3061626 RepID=UPI0026730382|nr:MaoC/PaaZ C-terminal domain-containing protein [Micromonospora sp. HUAS LYJ1]WKU03071.1 MaoC/PaaZ C-terminal domain-containing protein [Micromonospora sp. HUAS LYJ1]